MSEPIPETGLPEDEYDPDMPPDPEPGPDPDPVEGWSEADVAGERVALSGSPIVAGTPGGARVEVAADGLHAYDSTGAETARIQGEGGEFVGGEFRTSDALPGQVTLSDTGYVDTVSGATRPGISVFPVDTSRMATPPGIGATGDAMFVVGGRDIDGSRAHLALSPGYALLRASDEGGRAGAVQVSTDESLLRTYRADGGEGSTFVGRDDQAYMRTTSPTGENAILFASPNSADIRARDADNSIVSRIYAARDEAYLFTQAGGNSRYVTIDADGVWIKGPGGTHNLEETAQDSGWQPFSLESGFTGSASLAWRNKGGIIWFRGTVTGDFVSGYNYVARNLDEAICPEFNVFTNAVGIDNKDVSISMNSAGHIAIIPPTGRTATISMSGLLYPIG